MRKTKEIQIQKHTIETISTKELVFELRQYFSQSRTRIIDGEMMEEDIMDIVKSAKRYKVEIEIVKEKKLG